MARAIFICCQIDKLILEVSEFEKNEEKCIPLLLYFKITSQEHMISSNSLWVVKFIVKLQSYYSISASCNTFETKWISKNPWIIMLNFLSLHNM